MEYQRQRMSINAFQFIITSFSIYFPKAGRITAPLYGDSIGYNEVLPQKHVTWIYDLLWLGAFDSIHKFKDTHWFHMIFPVQKKNKVNYLSNNRPIWHISWNVIMLTNVNIWCSDPIAWIWVWYHYDVMAWWHGNTFRITGPWWTDYNANRWIKYIFH